MQAGERLGPYEITGLIGHGGMGEVYKARDPRLNRDVAIKSSRDQFTERFEREAGAIAALNHPNICTLYDVGPNYLVMEFVEGQTLDERIKEGPLPLEEALRLAHQITDALEAAHERGITHRDLKPGNIMIRPDGTVKVLDFGLAKVGSGFTHDDAAVTVSLGATQAGMILGTPAYMSPEQAKGRSNVDKRADIWAFGAVLYEMLTGERAFPGDRDLAVLPIEGGKPGTPQPYLHGEGSETGGQFSPDGNHVAYVLSAGARSEIYVSTFPDPTANKWPISAGGGYQPRWRRDGKELFYLTADSKLMSVEVKPGPSFGVPKELFPVPIFGGGTTINQTRWDVSPDGQRFLFNTVSGDASAPLTVVLNWQAGLP